jgi:hypothetical protein
MDKMKGFITIFFFLTTIGVNYARGADEAPGATSKAGDRHSSVDVGSPDFETLSSLYPGVLG